jgi:hypothetical protein
MGSDEKQMDSFHFAPFLLKVCLSEMYEVFNAVKPVFSRVQTGQ